jgi:galactokinase
MRALQRGSSHDCPDADAFVREAAASSFFSPASEVVVARAPGRLDLMGGIADYSGSLVLQWPLRDATLAALQWRDDRELRVLSLGRPDGREARAFFGSLDALFPGGAALDEEAARAWFRERPEQAWAAYALGPLLVLAREKGLRIERGLALLLRSSLPEGSGVSSSAALEVASLQAFAASLGLDLDPRELALLCQRAENRVVGAACGVMDQMTAACGRAGELLVLLCQPAELRGTLALPEQLEVWGIDSGVSHAVSGAAYTGVRVGAFMGARILADAAGLEVTGGGPGEPLRIEDARWRGHLANVTPEELEGEFRGVLPETLRGDAFLARYGGTTDPVTRVDPEREYPVRAATAHPVYEHARVRAFAELLAAPPTQAAWLRLGELMHASHASYSGCGLGTRATDLLVSLVRDGGPALGFFGAKITGGGGGGTVAVLGRRGADVGALAAAYAREAGHAPRVFSGSSPGAAAFGALTLAPEPSGGSHR